MLLAGITFLSTLVLQADLQFEEISWISSGLMVLNIIAGIAAIGTIFLFNNRKTQLKVATLVQYVALLPLLATLGGLFATNTVSRVTTEPELMALVGLPILGYIFIRLAISKIRKDIELVRSMDRLR